MKRCPECRRDYRDDSLLYCLDDGAQLVEGPGSGEDQDPFGRPQASYGPSYGESVKVPDKMDIQKAREILEELQRRAAERGRPTYELDYLDRLLRRF